ncbi:MAG: class I mannose-6-phosphate isomerase [Corallococcus sp.]|nr:class I mannose-6-phosphate isomerase [Corallococcus sp.]
MIVKLKPALKSYLWGGTKLKKHWNKSTDSETLSESWELSFNDDGLSYIDGGEFDGKPLKSVATRSDWGETCKDFEFFPTLIKLIDTQKDLSVQVHPSDEYALLNEGQYGKTEMWRILDCQKGARLLLGLKCDLTKKQFESAIADGTICRYMNSVEVNKDDVYFVPSGVLHAIGAGITLAEIQQNSSLTYRVYDFDRVDANGQKRALHVEKALQVADLTKFTVPDPQRGEYLGGCKYFSCYCRKGEGKICNKSSFTSVTVTEGQANIGGVILNKGETAFVSAGENAQIKGNARYLLTQAG